MLLVLGSPIWLSLAISAIAVMLSLYIVLWSLIVSVWAVLVSLAACSVGGVLACAIFTIGGKSASGLAMLFAGIACAGLAIFMFYGCKAATRGIIHLTKMLALGIKRCFIKKENS